MQNWLIALAVTALFACGSDPQAADADLGQTFDQDSADVQESPDQPDLAADGSRPDLADTPDEAPDAPAEVSDLPNALADTDLPGPDVGPDVAPDVPPAHLPARGCAHTFEYEPSGSPVTVHLAGSFNGWSTTSTPLSQDPDGVWRLTLDLSGIPPGTYGYKFVHNSATGAEWYLDPANKMRRFNDGIVNSKLIVPDCQRPELVLLERTVDPLAGSATIEVAVHTGIGGEIDPASPAATHNFEPLPGAFVPSTGTLQVSLDGLPEGKHTFVFTASGPAGEARPLSVSFWVEDEPFQWRDAVLYFAFVDRFRDGSPADQPASCIPADSPGNWQGGDWAGLLQAIESGYFDELGVNAIWINAPSDNPDGCVPGIGGYTYTAYHGYFPSDPTAPENHFGSLEDLQAVVKAAHARGIRVLIDLVLNHVHDSAEIWADHQGEGWFHLPPYVCGWDQPISCWFQDYLPDLDHSNDEVVEYVTEVAMYWARTIDVDGFRVDAVKHMIPHVLHTLRAKIEAEIDAHASLPMWTVGETFTGGWGGGQGSEEALIKQYVSPDQLHGQFDFPLYWALTETLARGDTGVSNLGGVLLGTTPYHGVTTPMASFLGNHDVSRFISHANGDIGDLWGNGSTEQGWENPPPQPTSEAPYQRLRMAFTFLAAAPWIPLIYYGDEVGLAGAGDPDNRRMLPLDTELGPLQTSVREHVQRVMHARLGSAALRRGTLDEVAWPTEQILIVRRKLGAQQAAAVLNTGSAPATVTVALPQGTWRDAVDDSTHQAGPGGLSVEVPALGSRLLVPPP